MTDLYRPRRTQKSPRAAGLFGRIGASTEVPETPSAGDYTLVAVTEQTTMPAHFGTRARVCHPSVPSSPYPDPSAVRRFMRFVADLQRDNSGQPVITTPAEIERATGVSASEQVRVRQTLMTAGVLRLSAIGNAWAYSLEGRA